MERVFFFYFNKQMEELVTIKLLRRAKEKINSIVDTNLQH